MLLVAVVCGWLLCVVVVSKLMIYMLCHLLLENVIPGQKSNDGVAFAYVS